MEHQPATQGGLSMVGWWSHHQRGSQHPEPRPRLLSASESSRLIRSVADTSGVEHPDKRGLGPAMFNVGGREKLRVMWRPGGSSRDAASCGGSYLGGGAIRPLRRRARPPLRECADSPHRRPPVHGPYRRIPLGMISGSDPPRLAFASASPSPTSTRQRSDAWSSPLIHIHLYCKETAGVAFVKASGGVILLARIDHQAQPAPSRNSLRSRASQHRASKKPGSRAHN
jgi:hypothetical protein